MKEWLCNYTVSLSEQIILALKKIDNNKHGFLVVVDGKGKVLGVLTDGDIRRGFIRGGSATDSVAEMYTKHCKTVLITDEFKTITELFKNQSIKFLPIVDDENHLLNIITKNQLYALLLQDIRADLSFDFFSLDTSIIDYEIYPRPWGFYKTTVLNDFYQAKVITVNPGGQLSLQSHKHREEHWIVVHGNGTVQLDQSVIRVGCGSTVFIPKGAKHRLINIDEAETLIVTEVQIGDYLGEDDIIRYADVYGRA